MVYKRDFPSLFLGFFCCLVLFIFLKAYATVGLPPNPPKSNGIFKGHKIEGKYV